METKLGDFTVNPTSTLNSATPVTTDILRGKRLQDQWIGEADVLGELESLLTQPAKHVQDVLRTLIFGGQGGLLQSPVDFLPVFRSTETSGYNLSLNRKVLAHVRFGVTTSNYFVIQSRLQTANAGWVSHYYHPNGKYAFSEGPISHQFAQHPVTNMEPRCPVVNHLYNILAHQYTEACTQETQTELIHTIETLIRNAYRNRKHDFSVSQGALDLSLVELRNKMNAVETDPVYRWKEKHQWIKKYKTQRAEVIGVKRRAHRLSRWHFLPALWFQDFRDLLSRFGKNPVENTLGALDRLLLDPIRWFFGVVRNNMGYSIALAIYSPFTFFFITQPMNPHAMWAVGNVRSAYLETTETIRGWFGSASPVTSIAKSTTPTTTKASIPALAASSTQSVILGIPLTTNQSKLDDQSWDDRMSRFKALQISYEKNMEAAPRFGRLEQMETQLNWPMIIEGAWLETERYLSFVNFILANSKDYAAGFNQFVKAEKERAEQVQLYLWDKNVRFILDHPYTLMNQNGEQTQHDYYVGRSFILLRDMTQALAARHQGLAMPKGFENIQALAQKFESEYQNGGSVLDRLRANSKVFAQKDQLNTDELRAYMKRQWEILYLLQNKAQEAANMGLQMYVWSVRNTAYLLQSLYSSKREELSMVALSFKKGAAVNKLSDNLTFKRVDAQFEALHHMLVLEFASLQKEFNEALPEDLETTQRKKIISGVESFLKERDQLLKSSNLL